MKAILVGLVLFAIISLVQAQPRPATVCTSGALSTVTEGAFIDLDSAAPDGFRVNIHSFSYTPGDTATFVSEYYFKTGTCSGFVETRWPWILHYTETVGLTQGVVHTYEPIPLVIGEQTVGYFMAVDPNDDMFLEATTAPVSDGVLTFTPITLYLNPPVFGSGTTFDFGLRVQVCFTYTLDQFGGLAVVAGRHHLRSFDGSEEVLADLYEGVYSLISHRALSVSARMCSSRAGWSVMCEAGMVLADGHRFVVEAQGDAGVPVLQVHRPEGSVDHIALDESFGTSVNALDLELDGGAEAEEVSVRSQLFVSAFGSNEEALQDAAIARHLALGDLDHLDLETTRITARVLLTTWAYEATLVAVEENGEASLVFLSHRRMFHSGTEAVDTVAVSASEDAGGILGRTARADGLAMAGLESFLMEGDSVLSTDFKHSGIQN